MLKTLNFPTAYHVGHRPSCRKRGVIHMWPKPPFSPGHLHIAAELQDRGSGMPPAVPLLLPLQALRLLPLPRCPPPFTF